MGMYVYIFFFGTTVSLRNHSGYSSKKRYLCISHADTVRRLRAAGCYSWNHRGSWCLAVPEIFNSKLQSFNLVIKYSVSQHSITLNLLKCHWPLKTHMIALTFWAEILCHHLREQISSQP